TTAAPRTTSRCARCTRRLVRATRTAGRPRAHPRALATAGARATRRHRRAPGSAHTPPGVVGLPWAAARAAPPAAPREARATPRAADTPCTTGEHAHRSWRRDP